jgi:mannose-6-phosphate isomerase-like protein (cupin superfamily)
MNQGAMIAAMTTAHATTNGGYAIAAGEGGRMWIVGDTATLRATGQSTGGSLVLLENLTARGGGPPSHVHAREDEFFCVLDGTFECRIGDEIHTLQTGGLAYVPRGTVHNFRNPGGTATRILVGFTPGGIEGFSRDSGRPRPTTAPLPRVDEDEAARTMAAAPKYGLEAVAFDDSHRNAPGAGRALIRSKEKRHGAPSLGSQARWHHGRRLPSLGPRSRAPRPRPRLREVSLQREPLGDTAEAVLTWRGLAPRAPLAAQLAGLPLTPEVVGLQTTELAAAA